MQLAVNHIYETSYSYFQWEVGLLVRKCVTSLSNDTKSQKVKIVVSCSTFAESWAFQVFFPGFYKKNIGSGINTNMKSFSFVLYLLNFCSRVSLLESYIILN